MGVRGVGPGDGNGGIMVVTISVGPKTLYMQGRAHHLTRVGILRLLAWLHDHAQLVRAWGNEEFVFKLSEVQP